MPESCEAERADAVETLQLLHETVFIMCAGYKQPFGVTIIRRLDCWLASHCSW